jgi:hypothetical protein
MKNNLRFFLILTLFIPSVFFPLMAQLPSKISIVNKSLPQLKRDAENYPAFQESFAPLTPAQKYSTKPIIKTFPKPSPFNGVAARHLALFCRIEVILEKKNGIPIKFRLGDIDKVDQLEGKFLW